MGTKDSSWCLWLVFCFYAFVNLSSFRIFLMDEDQTLQILWFGFFCFCAFINLSFLCSGWMWGTKTLHGYYGLVGIVICLFSFFLTASSLSSL